jgi:hypothetical protein
MATTTAPYPNPVSIAVPGGSMPATDYPALLGGNSGTPIKTTHTPSDRIIALARRVQAAKGVKLNAGEEVIKWFFGVLFAIPTLLLAGFLVVPSNHSAALFRFGKLDRIINRPGLAWAPLFYERIQYFTGTQVRAKPQQGVRVNAR